jgi:hypothetical protein
MEVRRRQVYHLLPQRRHRLWPVQVQVEDCLEK